MAAMSNGSSGFRCSNSSNIVSDSDVCPSRDDIGRKLVHSAQTLDDDSDDELLGRNQSLLDVTQPTNDDTESHEFRIGNLSTSDLVGGILRRCDNDSAHSQSADGLRGTELELANNADLLEVTELKIDFRDRVLGGAESRSGSRVEPDQCGSSVMEPGAAGETNRASFPLDEMDTPSVRPHHCHTGPPATTDMLARNQMITVVILCVTFMIGESIGGALSNSLALFTDVVHLGSDLISFIISLLAIYLSTKPASQKMSFGYHRAEVLGALFSVFLIWLVSGVLCYIAVERIIHEHYKDVKPNEMLITASLGVAFNVIMGIVLHSERCCLHATSRKSFGHGHSHTHSHHRTVAKNESSLQHSEYQRLTVDHDDNSDMYSPPPITEHRHKNINVRAAFIHVLGDIIQSLGVLVAALIIKLKPEEKYRLADPICTFLFSLLVLITTFTVLRDSLRVMLEGVPKDLNYAVLRNALSSLRGVRSVHSLHIWSLTIDRNSVDVHLAIDDSVTSDAVLEEATELLQHDFKVFHTTVQVERYHAEVMDNCHQCQDAKP
ncbi:zinc transporter 2-like [Gigantopelta aegis]|uniref:zinc transporter 2-like n=1 Tax=Gigantopelta aegis TaxID=1735272 RepID=UPI001B88871B|nr:zinc transporter 2-like [Gigantopelta aegis]